MSALTTVRRAIAIAGLAIAASSGAAHAAPVTLVFDVDVTRTCPRNANDPPCAAIDMEIDLTVTFSDPPDLGPAHSGHRQQSRWPLGQFSDVPMALPNPFTGVLTTADNTILFDRSRATPTSAENFVFLSTTQAEVTPAGSWFSNLHLIVTTFEPSAGPVQPATLDDLVELLDSTNVTFQFFTGVTNAAGEFSSASRYYDGTARLDRQASTIPDALPPTVVPEPTLTTLFGAGVLVFGCRRRRQR